MSVEVNEVPLVQLPPLRPEEVLPWSTAAPASVAPAASSASASAPGNCGRREPWTCWGPCAV